MLTYYGSDTLELVGYSDADFERCSHDMKSTSGYIFMGVKYAIPWKDVKQLIPALSTIHA